MSPFISMEIKMVDKYKQLVSLTDPDKTYSRSNYEPTIWPYVQPTTDDDKTKIISTTDYTLMLSDASSIQMRLEDQTEQEASAFARKLSRCTVLVGDN